MSPPARAPRVESRRSRIAGYALALVFCAVYVGAFALALVMTFGSERAWRKKWPRDFPMLGALFGRRERPH